MLAIQRKDKNQKGFTLAELLVVVAIIAVLVAVSIPIFTAKLEKSREATDIANMRAAKAAATVELLDKTDTTTVTNNVATMNYDASAGKLVASTTAPTAYGKGTVKDGKSAAFGTYDNKSDYTAAYITVTINYEADTVTVAWTGATK